MKMSTFCCTVFSFLREGQFSLHFFSHRALLHHPCLLCITSYMFSHQCMSLKINIFLGYKARSHGTALPHNRWMSICKSESRERRNRENRTSAENTWGMEGRIPVMPEVYIRNFKILRTVGLHQAKTSHALYRTPWSVNCPQCGGNALTLYDHYTRKAAFINDEGARRTLIIKAQRFRCRQCRYLFREPIEGLLPKKRSSEQYRQAMAHEYLNNVSNKTIVREFSVSESTVERIIHERFQRTIKQALNYPAPLMIGIDEHTIHKARTFATTIADLTNHRVYDVIEGGSPAQVERTLMSYKDRDKVTMVCMDLSSSYRRLVDDASPMQK